jgi:hypothetical protein
MAAEYRHNPNGRKEKKISFLNRPGAHAPPPPESGGKLHLALTKTKSVR